MALVALAAGAVGSGTAGARTAVAAQAPARPNLLLVTLDTLRADRVGAYGATGVATPALDRLAAEGVRFDQASTTAPLTLPAHASLFTAQNPYRHGVRDNHNFRLGGDALTLAELLAAAGWRTGGFIGAWVLNAETGMAQGFSDYTRFDADTVRRLTSPGFEAQRRGESVAAEALPWMLSRSGPFFAWVHLFDPHLPYDPPAPFRERYRDRPYDGEVTYADAVIGRLLESLDDAGVLDDTIVAVVADHGEGLGDHGEQRHSLLLYDEVIRVPMLLWRPGRLPAGVVVEDQVGIVDLMPTLLGLVGVADPEATGRDGVNLAEAIERARRVGSGGPVQVAVDGAGAAHREGAATAGAAEPAAGAAAYSESIIPLVEFGWSELRALRAGGFKYVAAPRPELYDLRADPGERDNLLDPGTERPPAIAEAAHRRADRMRRLLEARTSADDLTTLALGERFIEPEQVEALRALGYLGGGGVPAPTAATRADPKDHVILFEAFQDGVRDAGRALQARDWQAATAAVDRLQGLLPEHHLVPYYRGRLLLLQNEPEAAIALLEESRRLAPTHALAHTDLAAAYRLAGRTPESRAVLRAAMAAFPGLIVFPLLLGSHYHQDGLLDEALAAYRVALAIGPRSPAVLRNLGQLHILRGEYADAVAIYGRLVEELPGDPDARARYQQALERLRGGG